MGILSAPGEPEQLVLIQVLEDNFQRHAAHHPRPIGQARRHLDWLRADRRTLDGRAGRFFHLALDLATRLLAQALEQRRALPGVGQGIHRRQAFERIFAVENTRFIHAPIFGIQDPPAKAPVDRCSAHQHREFQPAPLQLVDNQRHLLAGVHQQRAQTDRGGICFDRLADDRLGWHLFAQVDHAVAVVDQDRLDQVLADIVHIAVNRRQHHCPLARAFHPLQVGLQVGHRLLHHLSRLQDKRQDQFSSPEFIPNLLHRRQQHRIERPDCCLMPG